VKVILGKDSPVRYFSRACDRKKYVMRETNLGDMDEQSRLFDLASYFNARHRLV
jgi:hypothetical protein